MSVRSRSAPHLCSRESVLGLNWGVELETPGPASHVLEPVSNLAQPVPQPFLRAFSTASGEEQTQQQGQHEHQLEKENSCHIFLYVFKHC